MYTKHNTQRTSHNAQHKTHHTKHTKHNTETDYRKGENSELLYLASSD